MLSKKGGGDHREGWLTVYPPEPKPHLNRTVRRFSVVLPFTLEL